MDFSLSSLIPGFLFGVIGFYLLKEGRRSSHIPWMLIGIILMIYPYFFSNLILLWGAGVALVGIAYQMR